MPTNAAQIGRLIVIEGIDGGGKKTQSKLLVERLQENGIKSQLLSFPMYETPTGKIIAAYLHGDIGKKEDIPPEVPALFYAIDRYQARWDLEKILAEGYTIVLDRYSPSNLAFQGAKFSGVEQKDFLTWIESVEARLPSPNLVLYLHVPVETTREWVQQRDQRSFEISDLKDIYERDFEYQKKVQTMYIQLSKDNNWEVINYENPDGTIKNKQEVHEEIWKRVASSLSANG